MSDIDLICSRHDGFRVDEFYFDRKKRFSRDICPRCSSPTKRVEKGTDTEVE